VIVIYAVVGVIVLAIGIDAGNHAAIYVHQHLAMIAGTAVFGFVISVIALRMLMNLLSRRVVKAWPEKPVKPPAKPKPSMPEPFASDEPPSRPFTLFTPEPTVLLCEGPGCEASLDEDPELRWRSGPGETPSEGDSEETHEFCSKTCLDRFWEKEDATPAPRG
jgi:hypothetical protein